MFARDRSSLLAVRWAALLVVTLVIAAAAPASATTAGHRVVVVGTVSALDAGAGTVAITPLHPSHAAAVSLDTNSQTVVTLDGLAVELADVPVGAEARAAYNSATRVAVRIDTLSLHALGAVQGMVTAVGASSLTITPGPGPGGGGGGGAGGGKAVTLTTDSSTNIQLNGAAAKLSAVATGDQAGALYDTSTLTAIAIDAQTPRHPLSAVEGQVTAVGASSVTITPADGGAAVTLATNSSTQILLDGAPSTLAALAAGDQASALYDSSTMLAVVVQARSAQSQPGEVEGQVTAVGAAAVTITPQEGGAAVTLATNGSTQIFLNGAPSTLSALATGDSARALYDSATLVADVIQAQAPHHQPAVVIGQVTAVSSASLTITPPRGSAVTVTTSATTQIYLNGSPVNLSAIAVGDQAQALYDSVTLIASIVSAEAPRHQLGQVNGQVTAVGAASITVTPEGPGGGSSPVALNVTSSTQISLDGKTSTLSAIAVKDAARVLYDTSTMDALSIEAGTPFSPP